MPVPFNLLKYGPLSPLYEAIDAAPLTEQETRALLQNLIDHIVRLENALDKQGVKA